MDFSSIIGGMFGGGATNILGTVSENLKEHPLISRFTNMFSGIQTMLENLLGDFSLQIFAGPAHAGGKDAVGNSILASTAQIETVTGALGIASSELAAAIKDAMQAANNAAFGSMGIERDPRKLFPIVSKLQSDLTTQLADALTDKYPGATEDEIIAIAAQNAAAITGLSPEHIKLLSGDGKSAADQRNLIRAAKNLPTSGFGATLFGAANIISRSDRNESNIRVPMVAINNEMLEASQKSLRLALNPPAAEKTTPKIAETTPPPAGTSVDPAASGQLPSQKTPPKAAPQEPQLVAI